MEGDIDVFDSRRGNDVDGVLLAAIVPYFHIKECVPIYGFEFEGEFVGGVFAPSHGDFLPRRLGGIFVLHKEAAVFGDVSVLRDRSSDHRLSSDPDSKVLTGSRDHGIGWILRILPQ